MHNALVTRARRFLSRYRYAAIITIALLIGLCSAGVWQVAAKHTRIVPHPGSTSHTKASGSATTVTTTVSKPASKPSPKPAATNAAGSLAPAAQPTSTVAVNLANANLQVNFAATTYALSSFSVGGTISTYRGGGNANITASATWKANLQALGPLAWRIPLRYNAGNPGSSAGGGQSSGDAATYVQAIRAIGGEPVVVVGGDTSDNNFTAADASGLVHYFNDNGGQHGGPVHAWVIGNEYSNPGNDPIDYQQHLSGWASAMKAVDPSITLSAPAAPDMKYADNIIATSISNAGSFIDYLSYHAYQGQSAGLGSTGDYQTIPNHIRSAFITPQNFGARSGQVAPALEEFNWAPFYSGQAEFYDWHNTVFIASVIGHSLSAGAHAYEYSDSNGPLGLMNDGSGQNNQPGGLYTKFPAYWGMAMWTGLNGQFKRYGGHLVQTSSSVPQVELFATDNGKLVLINKDSSSHDVVVALQGKPARGSYNLWQTNPSAPLAPPVQVQANAPYAGGGAAVTLPAGTVSSLDIN